MTISEWQLIGSIMRESRSVTFTTNVDLDTTAKRLIFGWDERRHACEVRAESGDCPHWAPAAPTGESA